MQTIFHNLTFKVENMKKLTKLDFELNRLWKFHYMFWKVIRTTENMFFALKVEQLPMSNIVRVFCPNHFLPPSALVALFTRVSRIMRMINVRSGWQAVIDIPQFVLMLLFSTFL